MMRRVSSKIMEAVFSWQWVKWVVDDNKGIGGWIWVHGVDADNRGIGGITGGYGVPLGVYLVTEEAME